MLLQDPGRSTESNREDAAAGPRNVDQPASRTTCEPRRLAGAQQRSPVYTRLRSRPVLPSGEPPTRRPTRVAFAWPTTTKPEVHDMSQHHQSRTEPRPQAACTENVVTFGCMVSEICARTDRQTDRQTGTVVDIQSAALLQCRSSYVAVNDDAWPTSRTPIFLLLPQLSLHRRMQTFSSSSTISFNLHL